MNIQNASAPGGETKPAVTADLASFDNEALVVELVHRLNSGEVALSELEDLLPDPEPPDFVVEDIVEDLNAFDEAKARWQRGDKREALVQLSYALGRDFSGLGDLRPEDLR